MTDEFDGRELIDRAGDTVGTIDRTYVDDTGNARMLSIKMGTILRSHRLVPADGLQENNDAADAAGVSRDAPTETPEAAETPLRTPYLKDVIEESPEFGGGDTIEGETLTAVREYYARDGDLTADDDRSDEAMPPEAVTTVGELDQRNRPPNDFPAVGQETDTPPKFGQVRDLGDVVEVPIVEEVLVRKPVVREVLRIRKSHLTETGSAAADVRKEEVEVVPSDRELIKEDRSAE